VLAALVLVGACAENDAPRPQDAVVVSPGPALWRVADSDTTVYLFGTFHALKPDVSWFDGVVREAYEAADEVALEATDVQDAERMQSLVMQYAIDPEGRTLSSVVGPQTADALKEALPQIGLSLPMVEPMEPWMVVTTIASLQMISLGFDPALGVDVTLQNKAQEQSKTLIGIEGAEAQLKLLDGLPEETQVRWLQVGLRDWHQTDELLETLLAQWFDGDVEAFADDMFASMAEVPELADVLLRDRNKDFANWIVERMDEPGTVFFAVGAGHLAGTDSVQDLLQRQGLIVERQ
jgi:hypothetical protein